MKVGENTELHRDLALFALIKFRKIKDKIIISQCNRFCYIVEVNGWAYTATYNKMYKEIEISFDRINSYHKFTFKVPGQ